jgi:hypothetical protein
VGNDFLSPAVCNGETFFAFHFFLYAEPTRILLGSASEKTSAFGITILFYQGDTMKKVRTLTVLALAISSIITVAQAHGQTVSVSETTIDFGNVAIGSQGSDIVTVTNISANSIIISASIAGGPGSFSTDSTGFFVLGPGGTTDVNVFFDPTSSGDAMGVLQIDVASPAEIVEVELIGTGGAGTNPCDLVQDILDYFDNAVANGTLEGTGCYPERRVRAMRNRLRAVKFLVCHGYFCQAAYVNQTAILRSDGDHCPRDFVQGSDLQAFNDQLVLLQLLLE